MDLSKLNIEWGKISHVKIIDIKDNITKDFLNQLTNRTSKFDAVAYVCSDARFSKIRDLLATFQNLRIQLLSSAGNVVYNPIELPSIVIGHGNSKHTGCGAVDYVRTHVHDPKPEFSSIKELVDNEPFGNAEKQIKNVKDSFRAGAFYFNHEIGTIHKIEGYKYSKSEIGDTIFRYINKKLKHTKEELEDMKNGQNPSIIYLSNLNIHPISIPYFSVQMQENKIHGIIDNSLKYAMDHALHDNGSFRDSRTSVLAFDKDKEIPENLDALLEAHFLVDYTKRKTQSGKNGEIYLVSVGAKPSENIIMRIIPN